MVQKRPTDFLQEKTNRQKQLENYRKMAADSGLGPWYTTEEEAENTAKFYSSVMKDDAVNKSYVDDKAIDSEINNTVTLDEIARTAFQSGKTVIANINSKEEPTVMENNTVAGYEEQPILGDVMDTVDETFIYEEEIDLRTGLQKFWDFMNKPFYVRTWFGFEAPKTR